MPPVLEPNTNDSADDYDVLQGELHIGRIYKRKAALRPDTNGYPRIAQAMTALRAASAVVHGEAVCCDEAGVAQFEKLHSQSHDGEAFFYAFDLLELDGEDWRPRPLEKRKARLEKLLSKTPAGIQYNEYLEGDGAAIFLHACKLGLEGIVSKHREHLLRLV
jgi:bifunctional non-homologous end joining protein LigD